LLNPDGLQNNGGPTQTIALPSSSPAINAGVSANCPATDQRELLRPSGECDSGAYQFNVAEFSATTSIASNFNGTPIRGYSVIWFNSNFELAGGPVPNTIQFTSGSIRFTANGTPMTLAVPDSTITLKSSATCASTSFSNNSWQTEESTSGSDEILLSGLAFLVPPSGVPGGIKNVTWSGTVVTDVSGVILKWKWGAAVYSSLGADYNTLGVKPTHTNTCSYNNSDHAGTPENFKSSVIGGATGGGGSNYTGGWSGTASVAIH